MEISRVYDLREEGLAFHSLYVHPDAVYLVNVPMRKPGSITGHYIDRTTAAHVLRYWRTQPGFDRSRTDIRP